MKKNYNGVNIQTDFWKPEVITSPNLTLLPEDTAEMYRKLIQSKKIDYFVREPKEFAISTWFWVEDRYRNRCWIAKTDIINLTSIEDLVSGQIIPPAVKKFFIRSEKLTYHYNYNPETTWDDFDKFIEYRNQMIEQAQERLDQSVSKAAYNIMKDLHS